MNNVTRLVICLTVASLLMNDATAQRAAYTTNGGLTIGFGLGAAYQQSDIANSRGNGFDFTFGSYLYKKENAFLSVDWKFRFLAGENKAFDHRINPDDTYSNIRYSFFNYDLEAGLTLNRLKERTRILVSGFAGVGITHGMTSADLLDGTGYPYDFSAIDPASGRKETYADLLSLSDNEFETKLDNRAAIMPTVGLYLGYQFSRSFSLGIEHKINFSLTEYNGTTGINIDNRIVTSSRSDKSHYTSLGFTWALGGGSSVRKRNYTWPSVTTPVTTPVTTNTRNTVTPVPLPDPVVTPPPPAVEIVTPSGDTYSTTSATLAITAIVKKTSTKQEVRVILNGEDRGFEYDQFYGRVSSVLSLREGRNTLSVTARNQNGYASDDLIIFCNKPVQTVPLPEIKFIDPALPVTVERNVYAINVGTRNVKAWQDVTVIVNGLSTSNFNFTPDGRVTTNISLSVGSNTVVVTGKNEAGTASDIATITYTKPVKVLPPVISIITPSVNPSGTYEPEQVIEAMISGVTGRENISLSLNGTGTPVFTFDNSSKKLYATIRLSEGNNAIVISAVNTAGQDVKTLTVTKETRPCPVPVFTLREPSQNDISTDIQSITIKTGVRNLTAADQLTVTVNNRIITDFTFTGSEVAVTTALIEGINTCTITAVSNCGTDMIEYRILRKPAVVVIEPPCTGPGVSFTVSATGGEEVTHVLKGMVTNAGELGKITLTVNGIPYETLNYEPVTGAISAQFRFGAGSHSIKATVINDCGRDEHSGTINIEEERPCGIRINPGNSSWEFCLVTTSDTITRDRLTDDDFSFSGRARSLFFKPIAGGGDAVVNGISYQLRPGQYYLFTGNLTVIVSKGNKGSMGQWSLCITADREPVTGNGDNRPKSPCEGNEKEKKPQREFVPRNNR